MATLVCRETYGSTSDPKDYIRRNDGSITEVKASTGKLLLFMQFFRNVFLPQGYPDSVSKDYLEYQIWDTVQAFCSSISGTLSTHAMLKGAGVGDETASAAAATITWLLRDGTGMTGRIAFAWYQGSSLDNDAKRWRLFADVMNDVALCLEIVAGYFPQYFTLIACISALFRSMVGVAGGATRAALTMHQARRNNMADVSAKDGSQETLVNLGALLVGLVITPMVAGRPLFTWSLFLLCTAMHLYANYRAVTSVVMETFNQTRFHIIVQDYLNSAHFSIPGPDSVNSREPVVWSIPKPLQVKIGVPFSAVMKRVNNFEAGVESNEQNGYLLALDMKQGVVRVILPHSVSSEDIIRACFQAEVMMFTLYQLHAGTGYQYLGSADSLLKELNGLLQRGASMSHEEEWQAVRVSGQVCDNLFPGFLRDLGQAGWVKGHSQLGTDEWRATWNLSGLSQSKVY